jgi:hypothetical protein
MVSHTNMEVPNDLEDYCGLSNHGGQSNENGVVRRQRFALNA